MNAVRKMVAGLFDSPTFGRDRTNLFTSFTIGSAGLLLNGAIMMFVMPLLLDPDDRTFRQITEGIGFGQTLSLILLGGATILATFLIPLRLISVFWGPRMGRYFDQVVLSGISPIRFVIGKALSQNLFLGLVFFLLLPYLVLCLTLGGVDPLSFAAGVFVLWLYCMALALVTLWLSLYINELGSAVLVIVGASFLCAISATPIPFQPFCLTPFPVLMQPVYTASPEFASGPGMAFPQFQTVFLGCCAGISTVIAFATMGIFLGPLYGIIRDNSTFGEVVRPGDSKRKRWFRLRYHIQRPSEIAFFYENRSDASRRMDGLLRWGLGFVGLAGLMAVARLLFMGLVSYLITMRGGPPPGDFAYVVHIFNLVVHGIAMILAVFVFSHARNTLYIPTPFVLGKRIEVARIDNWAFLLFATLSTAAAIGMPLFLEQVLLAPRDATLFPHSVTWWNGTHTVNFAQAHIEGTLALTLATTVLYLIFRHLCQQSWLKTSAMLGTVAGYMVFIFGAPLVPILMYHEIRELRTNAFLETWAPTIAMASPFSLFGSIFNELGRDFPNLSTTTTAAGSTLPFYVLHGVLLIIMLFMIRRTGRKLRGWYLEPPPIPAKPKLEQPTVEPSPKPETAQETN
ncbi:MAG: hypothetical protein AB8G99_16575 [Planctomycetaceae bacterium]